MVDLFELNSWESIEHSCKMTNFSSFLTPFLGLTLKKVANHPSRSERLT